MFLKTLIANILNIKNAILTLFDKLFFIGNLIIHKFFNYSIFSTKHQRASDILCLKLALVLGNQQQKMNRVLNWIENYLSDLKTVEKLTDSKQELKILLFKISMTPIPKK